MTQGIPQGLPEAIAVMTAWSEGGNSNDFAVDTLMDYIRDFGPDFDTAQRHMSIGMLNLCGLVLMRMEAETGKPVGTILQDIARHYAA